MAKKSKNTTISMSMPNEVNIRKADNGYTVSHWNDKGQKTLIAKSEQEAVRHAKALLTGKRK